MADVTLTSSIRSNLLSLQNTSKLLDTTSTRLSTGKKVNSALDNPDRKSTRLNSSHLDISYAVFCLKKKKKNIKKKKKTATSYADKKELLWRLHFITV